jgi:predicted alpha/beta hydrolase
MSPDQTPSLGAAVASLTLVTEDGFPLAATRWRALAEMRGVVVIAPATGMRRRFYAAFAKYLATNGFEVLTWDWRGLGDSRHEVGWRDRRLTMRAWGERDLAAAIAWADRRSLGAPVLLVGHSFGGAALGLAPNALRVERAVLVASQHGWCGHWPRPMRWGLRALWHVAMPATALALGAFPSSRVGLGEDLPVGVAREWARWCRRRQHLGSWRGHAAYDRPLLAYSFAGDQFAPVPAVEGLLAEFRQAVLRHRHIPLPADGTPSLGHFGFFREGAAPDLWAETAAFLGGAGAGDGR